MALALSAAACIVAAACGGNREQEAVNAALRGALTTARRPPFVSPDAEGKKLWKLTQQFYERREYTPAWILGNDPRPQMAELITTLGAARDEGLDPQLYNVALLEQRHQEARKGFLTRKGFDPEEAGALDAWLTYLYMKYASDLADGLSDLAHADPTWQIKAEKFDPAGRLDEALENNTRRAIADRAHAGRTAISGDEESPRRLPGPCRPGGLAGAPPRSQAETRAAQPARQGAGRAAGRVGRLLGQRARRGACRVQRRPSGRGETIPAPPRPRGRRHRLFGRGQGAECSHRQENRADRVEPRALAVAAAGSRRRATSSSTFRSTASKSGKGTASPWPCGWSSASRTRRRQSSTKR